MDYKNQENQKEEMDSRDDSNSFLEVKKEYKNEDVKHLIKNVVLSVLFFLFSVIMFLGNFKLAGNLGDKIFYFFYILFGWMTYLIFIFFGFLGIFFLDRQDKKNKYLDDYLFYIFYLFYKYLHLFCRDKKFWKCRQDIKWIFRKKFWKYFTIYYSFGCSFYLFDFYFWKKAKL